MNDPVKLHLLDPKIREKLRIESAIHGKPLIGPKSVNIHVINACNYRCEFCWYFSPLVKDHPKGKMLEYKVLESCLEDCLEIGVDEINLEGGETTVYPFWKEAFKKVHDLGMRLIAYTHLDYTLDADRIKHLAYAQKLTVNFSAMTEASFKRVHGEHTNMKRVLKNIDRLMALRDKIGKPQIVLSFVVYEHNYHELPAFLKMAQERRVDQVIVRFFEATEEMKGLVFSRQAAEELRRIVDEAMKEKFSFRHDLKKWQDLLSNGTMFENIVALDRTAMRNDRLMFYDVTEGKLNHCYIGWFYSHIDELGRVISPCDNVGVCIAGNINERRFKDIWFKNDFLHDTLKEAAAGIHSCSEKWQECRYCGYMPVNRSLHEKVLRASSEQRGGKDK